MTISATYNGVTYYLYNNNNVLGLTNNPSSATAWEYDGTVIHDGNYYVTYDNGWKLAEPVQTLAGYTIRSGSNYLNFTGSYNTGSIGTGTSTADNSDNGHTVWTFSNYSESGTIFTTITSGSNTRTYYLYSSGRNAAGVTYSTTNNYRTWQNNGSTLYNSQRGRYLSYSGGNWACAGTGTTLTFTPVYTWSTYPLTVAAGTTPNAYVSAGTTPTLTVSSETEPAPYTQRVRIDTARTAVTRTSASAQVITRVVTTEASGKDTFFPLVASDTAPFAVSQKNTGYIVGGSNNNTYQQEWGDVRISRYPLRESNGTYNLSVAFGGSIDDYSANYGRFEILTQTYLTGGDLRRVSDTYNSSNTTNNTSASISDYTKSDPSVLGLQKYDSARDQLHDTLLSDPTNIYGMHFMDAVISMDHLITAPKVVINGQEYPNYQMPEDSVDFRLRTKGYVNFFAATYYNNNDGFFSLHQIFRDNNNQITAIKRIEKIYGDPTDEKKNYIYKYENEADPSLPSGYVEMFDTEWIEHPTMIEDAMYYYEVPVNAGEYALGSVEGGLGAYLCYLDIGTSAASHASMIGTIDFVYDNLSDKIVVVPDTNENDTSLNYYKPSLAIMYTENAAEDNEDNTVNIGRFTVKVTRTITSVNDANATLTATFGEDDAEYLDVVAQHSGGDTIVKVYPETS